MNTSNVLELKSRPKRHSKVATLCAIGVGQNMACKVCKSENTQKFEGELTASLPDLKGLTVSPTYICQRVLVCLDCGFAELVIPTNELEALKKAKAAAASSRERFA